jgi:hypothetical protein
MRAVVIVAFCLGVLSLLWLPTSSYADTPCEQLAPPNVDDWFVFLHIYSTFNCCCCWNNIVDDPYTQQYALVNAGGGHEIPCFDLGCQDIPESWDCWLGIVTRTYTIKVESHSGDHYLLDEHGNIVHGPSVPYQWASEGCVCKNYMESNGPWRYCQQSSAYEVGWVTTYVCDGCPPGAPPC